MTEQKQLYVVVSKVQDKTAFKSNGYRSSTTPERFYHIKERHTDTSGKTYIAGTVFMREFDGTWYASVARCSESDNFCKATGRNVARRRWFKLAREVDINKGLTEVKAPSYEAAVALYKA